MKLSLLLISLLSLHTPGSAQLKVTERQEVTEIAPISVAFFLDGEKLDEKKGMAASSDGNLRVKITEAENYKADPARPVEVTYALIRENRPVSGFNSQSAARALSGSPLQTMFGSAPQPGDRILMEVKNVKGTVIRSLPVY